MRSILKAADNASARSHSQERMQQSYHPNDLEQILENEEEKEYCMDAEDLDQSEDLDEEDLELDLREAKTSKKDQFAQKLEVNEISKKLMKMKTNVGTKTPAKMISSPKE